LPGFLLDFLIENGGAGGKIVEPFLGGFIKNVSTDEAFRRVKGN